MTIYYRIDFLLISTILILISFFPSTLLVIPSGGSIALFVLLLSVIGLAMQKKYPALNIDEIVFILAFLLYFLVHLFGFFWFDLNIRELDTPSRFLLVMPIYLYLMDKQYSSRWVYVAIVMGALSAGLVSIYQLNLEDLDRARGSIEPGRFGLISSTLGLMCVSAILVNKNKLLNYMFSFGAFFGFVAAFSSGTRGAWISSVVVFVFILLYFFKKYRFYILISIIPILFLTHNVLKVSSPFYGERYSQAKIGFTKYFSNMTKTWRDDERYKTSVGARLELYKASYKVSKKSPIIGFGEGNFSTNLELLVSNGEISGFVKDYKHAHQEYLNTMVEQGLIGLLTLFFVFFYPFFFFKRSFENSIDTEVRLLSAFGIVISLNYIVFSFSSGSLDHQTSTLFYVFITMLLLSSISSKVSKY